MNGHYIQPLVRSLHNVGIRSAMYVDRDKWSGGTALDAGIGSLLGRNYDPRFPMLLRHSMTNALQFNLIGYLYGSIVVSQLAAKYAQKGTKIDHLVLIGSPISPEFLQRLKNIIQIKKVVVIDLGLY